MEARQRRRSGKEPGPGLEERQPRVAHGAEEHEAATGQDLPFMAIDWKLWYPKNLVSLLLVASTLLFLQDASYNALGAANGKFISLVDTVQSVAAYRSGLPRSRRDPVAFVRVLIGSFATKFAAQTAVSLALRTTPLLFKGPRHLSSFVVGLVLVWFFPHDLLYTSIRRSPAVKLLVAMSCGLYKFRKALFAVQASLAADLGSWDDYKFVFAFVLVLINLDGNSVVRRSLLWTERKLSESGASSKTYSNEFLRDLNYGISASVRDYMVPDLIVTGLLFYFGTDANIIELKIFLLVYFMHRQGAFEVLASLHDEGIKNARPGTPLFARAPRLRALATPSKLSLE